MRLIKTDWGKTADDYARFRAGFPDSFFVRLAAHGIGIEGQRLLDLGTGTGTLARGFARLGLEVTGLDTSAEMMREAERLDREAKVQVRYVTATAEETGKPDASFDLVTASQCWHWFKRDAAAREARRVLVPGGRLVIAHFDWLPLAGNVVEATEALIEAHNENWRYAGGLGLYPKWLRYVGEAGFEDIETFSYDVDVPYSHEAWRGRIRASAGIAASLPPERVARFDDELASLLAGRFPEEPVIAPHRVFAVLCRAPQGAS